MSKNATRIWFVVLAAIAGGLLVLVFLIDGVATRVALGAMVGACAGLAIYLYGKLQRS